MTMVDTTSQPRMTVDEFLAWAETQPARYELYNGIAYRRLGRRGAGDDGRLNRH